MEFAGQRVLVLGLGRTGRSAVRFLTARGARVTAADDQNLESLPGRDELCELAGRAELCLAKPFPDPSTFDAVVPSPGVLPERFAGARAVWSDIELAAAALAVPVVAVSGTNGKTTTVRLIEAMLRTGGRRAQAAGNVGLPALDLVGVPLDVAVLEVSSFQLEQCRAFRPRVAVLLNVAPDHLDRHGDFERYRAAKGRLFAAQRSGDFAIGNADDPDVRQLVEGAGAVASQRPRQQWFGNAPRGATRGERAWWDGAAAWIAAGAAPQRFSLPDPLPFPVESALVGLLVCADLGVALEAATAAWVDFRPPPHRLEVVAEAAGVTWINDSKATNPAAAQYGLARQQRPVLWIAGGRDKGHLDLGALIEEAEKRVRGAFWIGEAADRLERAAAGRLRATRAGSLEAAVDAARAAAAPGDVVLLSPAFASFDQFSDYQARGDAFRAAVQRALGVSPAPRDTR